MRAAALGLSARYPFGGTAYATPDAVSQIANGLSTTTYSYDQNGNLIQKTTDGVSTTYVWDYANRLIALGSGGATTTYGYDAFGGRVFQSTATTTTLYPFKWYSVASSTGSGAKYRQPRNTYSMATPLSLPSTSNSRAAQPPAHLRPATSILITWAAPMS